MKLAEMRMLGDTRLYERSEECTQDALPEIREWARGLDNIILQFRKKYSAGRAVAAPQMGIMKRLVCMHIDKPATLINPVLFDMSEEMFELWDDCMCFPNLLVRVSRHRRCKIRFQDLNWETHEWHLENDLQNCFSTKSIIWTEFLLHREL